MVSTWSDEEEDENEEDNTSEEESEGKLCLMAKGDSQDEVTSSFENFSCTDWEEAFNELLDKYDYVKKENKSLKKKKNSTGQDNSLSEKNACLEIEIFNLRKSFAENDDYKAQLIELRKENEFLMKVIDDLKLSIQRLENDNKIGEEKYEAIKGVNLKLQ